MRSTTPTCRVSAAMRSRLRALAQVLAVAERLDTLAGGFAAGLKPSGNKDPFALRRNALGLARTLVEGEVDCALRPLLALAVAGVGQADLAAVEELAGFILERLRSYYADQGLGAAQFDAVASLGDEVATLADFDKRLKAIGEFSRLPEAPALAAANKRIRNILRKNEGELPESVAAALLTEPAEQDLHAALADGDRRHRSAAGRARLPRRARVAWPRLREPVDAFFDSVMVMAQDAAVRGNRLALLRQLADRFATVAAVEQLSAA